MYAQSLDFSDPNWSWELSNVEQTLAAATEALIHDHICDLLFTGEVYRIRCHMHDCL